MHNLQWPAIFLYSEREIIIMHLHSQGHIISGCKARQRHQAQQPGWVRRDGDPVNSSAVQSLVAVVLSWRSYLLHCSHHPALQSFWVLWQLLQLFILMQGCLCYFLPPPHAGYPYPPHCPRFSELLTAPSSQQQLIGTRSISPTATP